MSAVGFDVDSVCPPGHLLKKVHCVRRLLGYNALLPIHSITTAIRAAKPDLLIPCDDLASRQIHQVYKQAIHSGDRATGQLIEYSLGPSENFDIIDGRTSLMKVAQQEGILVPKSGVVANAGEIDKWTKEMGFPVVLKADGTSSGEGVAIVNTLHEAARALRLLQAPPSVLRTMKWLLVNHDLRSLQRTLFHRQAVVNAQSFVAGREATSLTACWKGNVLAELHFEVLCEQQTAGPASVLKRIDNGEMSATAKTMARRLQLSGFHGFDFMLEKESGKAFLIEMNPRTTQVGHLALGEGRDLPAALYAAATGSEVRHRAKVTENDVIVLFPEAWLRNPTNEFLRCGYHDVPWEEPGLVQRCAQRNGSINSWLSRQKLLRLLWGPRLPRM
jgi:predicted ATP-grasp superfamily ATP-dependent carboligase